MQCADGLKMTTYFGLVVSHGSRDDSLNKSLVHLTTSQEHLTHIKNKVPLYNLNKCLSFPAKISKVLI
jgi:hypothetical protein